MATLLSWNTHPNPPEILTVSPVAGTITPTLSVLLSLLYTALYVGIIYLSPVTRPRAGLSRNNPFVIRTRIRGVTIVTLACVLLSSLVVYARTDNSWLQTLAALGLAHPTPAAALRAVALTAVLFTGPLLEKAVDWDGIDGWEGGRLTIIGWRNYIVVGYFLRGVRARARVLMASA